MNTRTDQIRTGQRLISPSFLRAFLLQSLLFLSPFAMPQGKPEFGPPIGKIPAGSLTPVRRISVNSTYLLCNSLQLQLARRRVWEPVLQSLGATSKDLDAYAWALDNAAAETCAERLDSPMMDRALGTLAKVMDGLEDQTFGGKSLLTRNEKIELSGALLQAAYDDFQSRCFDSRSDEAGLLIGRLPKTPDVGLGLAAQPASAALGRCGDRGGSKPGAAGIAASFALSEFQACSAKALSNVSQTCTDPAGQDRADPARRPPIENDTGWKRAPNGDNIRVFRANAPDGSYRNIYQVRKSDGAQITHTQFFSADDHLVRDQYDVQGSGQPQSFGINYDSNLGLPARERPSDPGAAQRWEAEMRRLANVRQRDWDEFNAAVEAALRILPSADPSSRPPRTPPGRSGPRSRDCQAMTISPEGARGLLRPQSASSSEGAEGSNWISGSDLFLSCLCTFGSRGAQMANKIARSMGEPGVSCSNNEWLRRANCVANPRGPADQIRTECLAYLREDNQFDTPQTACEASLQCPEGSHPIAVGPPGNTTCRCSKAGSSVLRRTGSGFNCALVKCPIPGSASSDPAVQSCCDAPRSGPAEPGAPPGGPPPPKPFPVPIPSRPPE